MKIGPIEKDIEAPAALNASPVVEHLRKLHLGDSFLIEDCDETIRSAFYREGKKMGIVLISAVVDGDKTKIRFWRIKEKAPRKYVARKKTADAA